MVYTKEQFLSLSKMESHFPAMTTVLSGKFLVRLANKWFELSEDITLEEIETVRKPIEYSKEPGWKQFESKAGEVYKVLSSNGKQEYDVKVTNGNFSCTCIAGGYGRLCKHVKEVKERIKNQ